MIECYERFEKKKITSFYCHRSTSRLTIKINSIGLLKAGDGQIIDANMRWQCGTIINDFCHIFCSKWL
jgi:hypothetical protein